ncbi:ABC transporter ATP-binding protein [Clostridium sp. AF18-27]|uniref:Oligopeptide transport system ATP-binding protein n=3 Tax=Enterocloster lavalensis TaxID=460384 RepID=A0A1I0HPW1_9FIRM|nr:MULTISPECIES: ABC transporter ATP-binding protein [Enterocloster]MBS5602908.1 ABC transporter ATP-binding protein [Enterocloster asparagiformis]RHR56158.1 ABC transporter ATP-binding protein [Clostridium sp. AF18-27]MCB6341477.1 ABC transporter ATP-binding protein [Enterocloster lavalensis]MDR3758046.1 ABC transporter ATP-binding protein [Enterocloster sp.]PST32125.1 ABC transporter ATP-binding protein [Enterocloster lavalensis]
MEDNKNLVEVKNLEVSFFTYAGEVKAVRGISYNLKPGEVMGIVGESGSGKSVSSYGLMGIIPEPGKVIGGQILFEGRDVTAMSEKELLKIRGKDISMIFQDPMTSLNPLFTIGNQIEESLRKHTSLDKDQRQKRMVELLTLVGINQPEKRLKQYPHEFSGGMRQRVMIAMALACDPKLLIADEPTTALDVTIQAQILELLKELKDKIHMGIVFITHDLGVVSDICDSISVMYAGTIVESGSSDQIFYEPRHPYTWGLLASVPKIDTDEHQRLIPIEGNPVDLINPPKGCPFAPRCKHCMKICIDQAPPQCQVGEGHMAACWLPVKEAREEEE